MYTVIKITVYIHNCYKEILNKLKFYYQLVSGNNFYILKDKNYNKKNKI